ncbi:unnamed protein product [Nippostrongylus brasiliensis]|uniref:C-CAP/cofactor C-like domain-containing protein n=1 Tax=Nippostrongylus brasiliensis TaxID=27835 RepID=A0A158QXH6_NIPBR|nr:unnamed protein product [Nippostrongylus brasiliensis]
MVLDYTSTITVDDCSDCLIVLAPCAGSVFIRDCESCTVLVACQQLRTRDCRGLRLALHCATQPIIEETTNAVFHPLTLHYDKFTDDMIGARLSPFFSHSTSVHDFTPEKSELHYRLSSDVLPLNFDQISVLSSHGISTNPEDSDIPFRAGKLGARFVPGSQFVILYFDINQTESGSKLALFLPNKLVVFEVCGEEHDLEQLMSDGGFEKVTDYKESSFAAALTSINQLMLS